jgi:hypothetical protein
MDTCEIIQADFAETLRRVAEMGGADLILTSPPYADARTYGAGVSWTMADYQCLGDAVKPALKPGGHCLMVLDAPVREWRPGYGTERGFLPWQVMLDWAERVGLRVPDRMAYGRRGVPGDFGMRFRNDWEPLIWVQRSGAEGYIDKVSVAERAVAVAKFSVVGLPRPDGSKDSASAFETDLRHKGNFWWYGAPPGGSEFKYDHKAAFMLAFAEDAVRCFAPVGGLVCDPFTGSGTSAVAAAKHGRRFFGGDLLTRPADGKPWAEVAMERVRTATAQQNLFGGAA